MQTNATKMCGAKTTRIQGKSHTPPIMVFCTGAGPDQYNMKEVTAFINSKFPA